MSELELVADVPDGTSSRTCTVTELEINHTTTCTITPRKAGAVIFARSLEFPEVDTPVRGVVSALSPSVGNSFQYTYTAGLVTGPIQLGSAKGTAFDLLIYGGVVCGWCAYSRAMRSGG